MNNDKFLGHNGFLWFTGVVEDRNDFPQRDRAYKSKEYSINIPHV